MLVLQVIARMNVGGTAQYLNHLITGLNNQGIASEMATGNTQGNEIESEIAQSITVHRIKKLGRKISLLNDLIARRELAELIREMQPDIVHTHTFKAGLLVRSLRLRVPVVHTFHGHLFDDPEFSGFKSRVIIWIERLLAARTNKIVTVGNRVMAELLREKIGNRNQYLSIAPGVDRLQLAPKSVARLKYGIPDEALVGGWLGRFAPVKNPEMMLEIARKFPEVTFVMGGAGVLVDQISELAPSNLKLLGWVDPEEFLGAIDFLVSTSFNEGMPVAFIEAQQAGLPVIATNVGSVSEVIQHGISGEVVQISDLINTLAHFLHQPELQQKYRQAAATSGQRFTVKNLIDQHIALYKSI